MLDKARRAHNGYFNNTIIIERVIERLYDRFPSEYHKNLKKTKYVYILFLSVFDNNRYLNELFARIAKLDPNAMMELACVDQLIDDQGVVFITPDHSSEFYAASDI